jgi:hypothetical protein
LGGDSEGTHWGMTKRRMKMQEARMNPCDEARMLKNRKRSGRLLNDQPARHSDRGRMSGKGWGGDTGEKPTERFEVSHLT